MKIPSFPFILATIAFAFLTLPSESSAQNVGEMYRQARTAFSNGDLQSAKTLLDQIIAAKPSYVPARALKAQVDQQLAARGGGDTLKKKCASTIIPMIDFRDVELKLALEALATTASNATGGKFRPNIILSGGEEVENRRVTLHLRGAPLSTAIEYLGAMAKVDFRYERFAIVGSPKPGAGVAPVGSVPKSVPTTPTVVPDNPFEKR